MKTALAVALAAACLVAPVVQAQPASSYAVVDRIPGADGYYDFASIDAAGTALYVGRGEGVMKIALPKGPVTDTLAPAQRAHEVLVLDGGATLFVTEGNADRGLFVDARNGHTLASVATGKKPDAAFYDAKTGRIAVMNADDGTVTLIDAKTRKKVGAITVGGGLEFGVPDGRGGAFINIEDRNEIARVDLVNAKRTGTIKLPGCEGPTGLALVGGGKALISACANKRAIVTSPATGKTLATLAIGEDPDAVLTDGARGLAFIPCGGSGTLVALATNDPAHIRVVATIPTQIGAKTGAVDPKTGHIYLPAAKLGAVQPGAKRGAAIPGSFAILVVAPRA